MNQYQKILLKTYDRGEYAWTLKDETLLHDYDLASSHILGAGDRLLAFMWFELGDDGDTSGQEYMGRMVKASGLVVEVAMALSAVA